MKLNFSGKIAKFFLYNRPLTILILIGIIFAGFFSYQATPKQYNPKISMPAFEVIVKAPGYSAAEIEKFVIRELEEKIADVPGVNKIFSQSIDGGVAVSFVQFKVGEKFEDASVKLTNKILGNLDLKPQNIGVPLIKSVSSDDVPILTVGFWHENLSQNQVRTLAYDIMNSLRKVPNTANLNVHGGESLALKIVLDEGKMKMRKVAISDIKRAILANNFKFNTGLIKNEERFLEIKVDGQFADAENAKKIIIAPGLKLEDIAQVFVGYRDKTSFVEVFEPQNSREMVFVSLAKKEGSNAQEVVKATVGELEHLLKNPRFSGLKYEIFRDEGAVAHEAISELMRNLMTSILIVSLVLWVFLGLRSASIVAIAIPLTMACVFVVGLFSGQSINRITLFALILSLGLLVDSATVVVENIYRHLRNFAENLNADNRKKAIIEAVNEVGVGLFLSTLTSVIVFLPASQLSGMMGDYMRPLSFFLPFALIFSMIIAYILTPFLADLILPHKFKKLSKNQEKAHAKGQKVMKKYAKFLAKILDKKRFRKTFLAIVFGMFFLVLTFPVLGIVNFKMLPSADKNQFFIYLDAPNDTNFPLTRKIAGATSEILLQNPNVVSVQSFVGTSSVVDFNGLFRGSSKRQAPYLATLKVNLVDKNERKIESTPLLNGLRKTVLENLAENAELKSLVEKTTFKFLEDPPGPPVRATLLAKIKGPDRQILTKVANDLEKMFHETDGVVDIANSLVKPVRQVSFTVDHEKALASGISTHQIFETLNALTSEINVSEFHLNNYPEVVNITLSFPAAKKQNLQNINNLFVRNFAGEMVPLSAIVRQQEGVPEQILFVDERQETVYVSAELSDRSVVYANIDLIKKIFDYAFPDGGKIRSWNLYGLEFETKSREIYQIEWGGEWEMTLDNFSDLGFAMMVAFIAIYGVLVAQFKSFKIPLLIMSTVFLGLLGIMPGFGVLNLTWGTFLTATSLIGFIALMGIVVNNAIIYLEYFDILRTKGLNKRDALFEAGKTRLRPIMLTSLTTVLGNLTIVSDPVWSGLAWAIVFGLSISAIFTLGVFPALMISFETDNHS